MGTYTRNKNIINITELPFQVWNESYVEKMEAKTNVLSVDDNSSKTQISIDIKLKQEVESSSNSDFDSVEEFCLLKKRLNKHLNVIQDGIVRECKTYKEILIEWFVERYNTYVRRFDRLRIIIRLRIIFMKQVIKFVEDHKKYNFSILNETDAIGLLKKDKFIMFNKSLLDNPAFTPLPQMEFLICDSEAQGTSYNYLFAVGPRQRMEAARIERVKKLKDLEIYYKKIMSGDIVKNVWLDELKELNNVITKGTTDEKGWLYGERKVKFK